MRDFSHELKQIDCFFLFAKCIIAAERGFIVDGLGE
jgi:hypothetical protein